MIRNIRNSTRAVSLVQQRSFFVARSAVYDKREWEGNEAINDQVNVLKPNDHTYYTDAKDTKKAVVFSDKDMPPRYLNGVVDRSELNTALNQKSL
ncbi:chromosomal replication initiator protein DnaA [Acrasis kona]|uniref:Chromosomal replication initiator protein DnaA n=1 Tax=Acrasis kona TaxID=1008807 RepID=A0AAW2ZHE8_9EUKA